MRRPRAETWLLPIPTTWTVTKSRAHSLGRSQCSPISLPNFARTGLARSALLVSRPGKTTHAFRHSQRKPTPRPSPVSFRSLAPPAKSGMEFSVRPSAQQCLPGQSNLGSFCQTACAIATSGSQNYIQVLRMARQDKDRACTQNPTGDECRSAGTTYDMRLSEYRTYRGGVPMGCALPDPISI